MDENTRRIEPFDLVDEYFYDVSRAFRNLQSLGSIRGAERSVILDAEQFCTRTFGIDFHRHHIY